VARGDPGDAQFERIARDYGAALLRVAAAYAPEPADRDDLLQEILLAVWQALPSFRGESSEKTFIFRIAHNRGMTFATRRRKQHPSGDAPETLSDPRPGPEAELLQSERRERLLSAVRRLPERLRQAATLYLEGLSNREIAEVQGTTENNVAVRLTRSRAMLRVLLGEESGDR